jgi:hypothetical protein
MYLIQYVRRSYRYFSVVPLLASTVFCTYTYADGEDCSADIRKESRNMETTSNPPKIFAFRLTH